MLQFQKMLKKFNDAILNIPLVFNVLALLITDYLIFLQVELLSLGLSYIIAVLLQECSFLQESNLLCVHGLFR